MGLVQQIDSQHKAVEVMHTLILKILFLYNENKFRCCLTNTSAEVYSLFRAPIFSDVAYRYTAHNQSEMHNRLYISLVSQNVRCCYILTFVVCIQVHVFSGY